MDETTQPSPLASAGYEGNGGWSERVRRNTSSVLLPIIALLVLAGGVYFYTRGRELSQQPIVEFQETTDASPATQPTATPTSESTISLSPEGKPVINAGTVTTEGNMFKVRAQRGEGITHLARHATQEYLARTNAGFTVTKEHKIYIEDFLKRSELNRRGGKSVVSLNEEIAFSDESIKQAVEGAKTLNPQQLSHLAQFSARVAQL
ncbi:MAG: hypothetical protein Q8R13_01815 [bacterium]|nr:hypothetical protein [bacterium]